MNTGRHEGSTRHNGHPRWIHKPLLSSHNTPSTVVACTAAWVFRVHCGFCSYRGYEMPTMPPQEPHKDPSHPNQSDQAHTHAPWQCRGACRRMGHNQASRGGGAGQWLKPTTGFKLRAARCQGTPPLQQGTPVHSDNYIIYTDTCTEGSQVAIATARSSQSVSAV